ncbi:4-hydroxy-tetrahydrodipicolinate reductase [candidate division KSB1 bacterium]
MPINICIAGATGWTGQELVRAVQDADDLDLTGAVSPSNAGKQLKECVPGYSSNLLISGNVEEALEAETDVLIDFTKPDVVKENVLTAFEKGVNAVIGTSGLTEEDYAEIDKVAKLNNAGALAAGNFAITAVLLAKFSEMAAKYVPKWEVIDYAYDGKPDAPSGTARELAFRLGNVRQPGVKVPVESTAGVKETRGASMNGMQVHSIRLPGYVLSAEVLFGAEDERLSLRHDAGSSARPYVAGALLAARKVGSFTGLKRGLDSIMDF